MFDFSLTTFIQAVGYPGLIATVYFESGVFFGFFLPGASMLFTAGLLASQGFFNIWMLLPLLTLAAILGDNTGYWFGAKFGIRLFLRPDSKFFKQEHLKQAKEFYDRHGGYAVFLGRFIPVIRTFAPIIAGVVHMRYRTFVAYNIAGAIAWATGVTFAGYYLGRFPFIQHYLSLIILCIIVATTIPLVVEFLKRKKAVT